MGKTELAGYIEPLGLGPKLRAFRTNFEMRLEFQKTIYLLQEAGTDLGYRFGWYKHGPYSSSLADDGYVLGTVPADVLSSFHVGVDNEAIRKLKELISGLPKNSAHYLELVSSVHYVASHSYPKAKNKKEAVDSVFALKGDMFSKAEIEAAYDLLKSKGFIREQ